MNAVVAVEEEFGPEVTIGSLRGKDVKGKLYKLVDGQPKTLPIKTWGKEKAPPETIMLTQVSGALDGRLSTYYGYTPDGVFRAAHTSPDYRVVEITKKPKWVIKWVEKAKIDAEVQSLSANRLLCYSGSDPEIFAINEDGSLLPAFEFLQSKKENEVAYWDGYQGEFTVVAATCLKHHTDNLQRSMNELYMAMKSKFPKAKIVLKNVFDIPPERLEKDDEKFVNFGCTPSLNAYGEEPVVMEAKLVPFRTAGGHLHFSIRPEVRDKIPEVVRELDRVLGVISVALFQYYDEARRRVLYGRAGEYRTPEHGLEYRVLSNAWLVHPAIAHFVYEIARVVMGQVLNKGPTAGKFTLWDVTNEEAREVINNCDVAGAIKLLERNNQSFEYLLGSLQALRQNPTRINLWKQVVLQGVHKFVENPDIPSKDWALGTEDYKMYYHCMAFSCTSLQNASSLEEQAA